MNPKLGIVVTCSNLNTPSHVCVRIQSLCQTLLALEFRRWAPARVGCSRRPIVLAEVLDTHLSQFGVRCLVFGSALHDLRTPRFVRIIRTLHSVCCWLNKCSEILVFVRRTKHFVSSSIFLAEQCSCSLNTVQVQSSFKVAAVHLFVADKLSKEYNTVSRSVKHSNTSQNVRKLPKTPLETSEHVRNIEKMF